MVGNAAVSGGVRRTAMISLFDYDDLEMRLCKSGDFERDNSQRWNANNSAVWPERGLDQIQVIEQVLDMVKSQRGEPGIFNRQATLDLIPERRKARLQEYGTNPCGEIILRKHSSAICRSPSRAANDTLETLKEKVEVATIIGTIQSLATNFPGPAADVEAELRGGAAAGRRHHRADGQPGRPRPGGMQALRGVAIETNRGFAAAAGHQPVRRGHHGQAERQQLAAVELLVRPARALGAVLRAQRARRATSPIFKVLRDAGVPMDPENGQTRDDANTWVIHFPMKSPEGAITRKDRGAIEQCNYWLHNKVNWTDHNPSASRSPTNPTK